MTRRARRAALLAAAALSVGFPRTLHAAFYSIEMKALSAAPSTTANNYFNQVTSRTGLTIGQVVTVDLWGVLSLGPDGDPGDDGHYVIEGSFRSYADPLKVNLGAPSTSSGRGVLTSVVQTGVVRDVDGDNDRDLGDITYTSFPIFAPIQGAWFGAGSGPDALIGGSGSTREIITDTQMIDPIARLTFTVTSGFGTTSLNFVPRYVNDGNPSDSWRVRYVMDDNVYKVDGNGNGEIERYNGNNSGSTSSLGTNTIAITDGSGLAVGSPVVLQGPEPAGLGLLAASTAVILLRRKRGLKQH